MTARGSSCRRIELRKAWLERKQRATAVKQELRWKRRAARLGKKRAPDVKEAPAEVFVDERAPEEKPTEEASPEKKTEVPRALFPE